MESSQNFPTFSKHSRLAIAQEAPIQLSKSSSSRTQPVGIDRLRAVDDGWKIPVVSNLGHVGSDNSVFGKARRDGDLPFQLLWQPKVVGIQKRNQRSARSFQSQIPARPQALCEAFRSSLILSWNPSRIALVRSVEPSSMTITSKSLKVCEKTVSSVAATYSCAL